MKRSIHHRTVPNRPRQNDKHSALVAAAKAAGLAPYTTATDNVCCSPSAEDNNNNKYGTTVIAGGDVGSVDSDSVTWDSTMQGGGKRGRRRQQAQDEREYYRHFAKSRGSNDRATSPKFFDGEDIDIQDTMSDVTPRQALQMT